MFRNSALDIDWSCELHCHKNLVYASAIGFPGCRKGTERDYGLVLLVDLVQAWYFGKFWKLYSVFANFLLNNLLLNLSIKLKCAEITLKQIFVNQLKLKAQKNGQNKFTYFGL